MSRYRANEQDEFQSGSRGRVLKNLLGITSVRAIQRFEYEALERSRKAYFNKIELTTVFTTDLIVEMHRDWLGEIYPFAGKFRTVDVIAPAQGGIPEFRFSRAGYIPTNMATFSTEILGRIKPCRATGTSELSEMLAEAHAEFIAIHPFREGNGRVGRWITQLMALQAGFPPPDHGFSDRNGPQLRREYYRAMSVALNRKDYKLLTSHFQQALDRGERSYRA